MNNTRVEFDNVSIVFGDKPQAALPLMDEGQDRGQIQRETGQVLGVHDCSLDVTEGEILVLMGLSGSGKSTLLRAVNGLNPVARGCVRVHDGQGLVDVTNASAEVLRTIRLRHVAMVFQQFGLLPWRSVRENVGLGLELGGQRRPSVTRRSRTTGLGGPHRLGRPQGRGVVGRNAAARRTGSCFCNGCTDPAHGRTVFGARSADPHQVAG